MLSAYDSIDVINVCTLRTITELLFRELRQYPSIENFYFQTLNGVSSGFLTAII